MSEALAFLCVDEFLEDVAGARALKTALELGVIDLIQGNPGVCADFLSEQLSIEQMGLDILLVLLRSNGVLNDVKGLTLTERFAAALKYRDLLEAKLDFANLVAPDLLAYFTDLIARPSVFMKNARIFKLFNYGRCFDDSDESLRATQRWMRFTTVLTRYEAQTALERVDFGRFRRMLDIGGNSGEFGLQVCRRYAEVTATIYDLPLVCRAGQIHIASEAERDRIQFISGDALVDPFPSGFDLITFKSMLHDWPEAETRQMVVKAIESLEPGGTLLVFERGRIQAERIPFSLIPMLLFFRSFREPSFYEALFEANGLQNIHVAKFELEMPFFLITGEKPRHTT